ncbi:hypothetical protein P4O66_019303 [Electrophorus voltai]|uniref:Uncharacterized protein n=1 Tax=Electrophorus voltai TaxID=2609070 RepID=A0AAD8ZT31_9TELE|nr:hypothetical protein P4O66_019303 [Electrophorus voltai]
MDVSLHDYPQSGMGGVDALAPSFLKPYGKHDGLLQMRLCTPQDSAHCETRQTQPFFNPCVAEETVANRKATGDTGHRKSKRKSATGAPEGVPLDPLATPPATPNSPKKSLGAPSQGAGSGQQDTVALLAQSLVGSPGDLDSSPGKTSASDVTLMRTVHSVEYVDVHGREEPASSPPPLSLNITHSGWSQVKLIFNSSYPCRVVLSGTGGSRAVHTCQITRNLLKEHTPSGQLIPPSHEPLDSDNKEARLLMPDKPVQGQENCTALLLTNANGKTIDNALTQLSVCLPLLAFTV